MMDGRKPLLGIFVTVLLAGLGWTSTPVQIGSQTTFSLDTRGLPPLPQQDPQTGSRDWLVTTPALRAGLFRGSVDKEIILDNGLVRRSFRLAPNGATVGFDNLMTGASIIRGVKPEATVTLDGQTFAVGGLTGQPGSAPLLFRPY